MDVDSHVRPYTEAVLAQLPDVELFDALRLAAIFGALGRLPRRRLAGLGLRELEAVTSRTHASL